MLVKKSIEENKVKEKEQIKTISQLEHRIFVASERSSLLKEQTDTKIAEKDKNRTLAIQQSVELLEERFELF